MAINWSKIGKWTAILAPIGIAGIWYYNKTQREKAANFGGEIKVSKPENITQSSNNKFPLKKGVKNNEYVGVLQQALGVVVDNWFWNETLAALQQKANKSEIKDLQDLNNTIALINSNYNGSENQYRVNKILYLLYGIQSGDVLQGGENTSIRFNKNAPIQTIVYNNVDEVWEKDGSVSNIKKGTVLSKDKYQFMSGSDFNGDGKNDLVIYSVMSDTYRVVNPNDIDVI